MSKDSESKDLTTKDYWYIAKTINNKPKIQ
jgi:hypothetical protein